MSKKIVHMRDAEYKTYVMCERKKVMLSVPLDTNNWAKVTCKKCLKARKK